MGSPTRLTQLRSEHQRLQAMLELDGVTDPLRAYLQQRKHALAAEIVACAADGGAHIELRVEAAPTSEAQSLSPPPPEAQPTMSASEDARDAAPVEHPAAPAPEPKPPRRRLTSPLRPPPREDFGDFVTGAHPEEEKMLREIVQRAKMNPRGGTVRKTLMHGTNDQNGYTIEGARLVTIDLRARTLSISEVWGGLTTARRTRPLDGI